MTGACLVSQSKGVRGGNIRVTTMKMGWCFFGPIYRSIPAGLIARSWACIYSLTGFNARRLDTCRARTIPSDYHNRLTEPRADARVLER